MNKENRKQLEKAADLIEQGKSIVEEIKDDEQGKFDNLTEGLQQAESGQKLEQVVGYLEEAFDSLEVAIGNINSASE